MAAWAGIIVSVVGMVSGMLSASGKEEASKHATNRQIDIANRVQYREELLFRDWEDEVKNLELKWAAEVFAIPSEVPDYNTAILRATTQVRRQFARPREEVLRCINIRCVGAKEALVRNLIVAEASAVTWAASAAIHAEDERVELYEQQIREEQFRALAAGHQKFFSTRGSAIASQAFGQQARAAEKAAAEASRATGYFFNRAIEGFDNIRSANPQQRPEVFQQRESRANTMTSPYYGPRPDNSEPESPVDPYAIRSDDSDF